MEKTTFDCSYPQKQPEMKSECAFNHPTKDTIHLIKAFDTKTCGPLERNIAHEVSHAPPFKYSEDNAFIFEYALFGGLPVDPVKFREEYYELVSDKEMFDRYDDFYYSAYLLYLK